MACIVMIMVNVEHARDALQPEIVRTSGLTITMLGQIVNFLYTQKSI